MIEFNGQITEENQLNRMKKVNKKEIQILGCTPKVGQKMVLCQMLGCKNVLAG